MLDILIKLEYFDNYNVNLYIRVLEAKINKLNNLNVKR
jgi:hypothetical protein